MPLYEYICGACGARYEKREGFDAPARQSCQTCGRSATRVLHAPPIVFKGSGFYKTDSRGTSSASSDDGARPSTPEKAEVKPAAKPAAAPSEPPTESAAAG